MTQIHSTVKLNSSIILNNPVFSTIRYFGSLPDIFGIFLLARQRDPNSYPYFFSYSVILGMIRGKRGLL